MYYASYHVRSLRAFQRGIFSNSQLSRNGCRCSITADVVSCEYATFSSLSYGDKVPHMQDCCRIVSEFCSRIVPSLLVLIQIQFICNIYSYFLMCYAWVARFLQDCSKIVSIHSKAIHVYYSFSLIFTCAMHKIVAGVLQDDCNIVVGLLPDCWHKFKYNTKKAWSRLLQDCYKIIARLLQERCKINSWSNNFLRETQHNLTSVSYTHLTLPTIYSV